MAIKLFGIGKKRSQTEQAEQERRQDAFIQMSRIVKTFKTPVGDFTALKGIDAHFKQGEFISVIGKSGSGKSTLVNMLTGIDRPTSGQVQIGDTFVHILTESQMARWRGRNLGIVFQFYQLLPMLSLLENVMLPMDISQMYPPGQREARALELLRLVGLEDVADQRPASVSGGQQQSAAIARAMANDPPLIIADEPTGNLDSAAAERVIALFEQLVEQGKTIIMVTHDRSLAQRASRSLLLADGEVVNSTVVNALPLLTHQQMLKATHHLRPRLFEPGTPIIYQGEPNDYFYMITQGTVEVTLKRAPGQEITLAHMGPGQHFGEISVVEQVAATANVKAAAHGPVEVAALNRDAFMMLLAEAQEARLAIQQVVEARLAENAAQRAALGR